MLSSNIAKNVQNIQEGIRQAALKAAREPSSVQLVAATKTVEPRRLLEAYHAGVRIFGENRLQEAQEKVPAVGPCEGLAWHFIGRMQRRKLKDIVGRFALLHSVESLDQAKNIQAVAKRLGIRQNIFLEVNVSGEKTKGGFAPSEIKQNVEVIDQFSNLTIQGLMTLPPFSENSEHARPYFAELRHIRDSLVQQNVKYSRVKELSMGMSRDYQVAIEEGATMVRIGTAIFGWRQ